MTKTKEQVELEETLVAAMDDCAGTHCVGDSCGPCELKRILPILAERCLLIVPGKDEISGIDIKTTAKIEV